MSLFRGKLLTKSTYSSTGSIEQTEQYQYNIDSGKNKYNISVRSVPRGCASYKIYLTPCLLTQQSIIDKNGVEKQTVYTYNDINLIRSITTTNSDGKEYRNRYKYIGDYDFNITVDDHRNHTEDESDKLTIYFMKKKNMLEYLAEEQTLILKNGMWNLLNGKLIIYRKINNLYHY
ncbi:MAG: hypothetical protein LBG80_07270 [Bacteroidales bacterium]|jgi:hypothetical protein|nr:hypothetical protein [Bacteroidales bacterium]